MWSRESVGLSKFSGRAAQDASPWKPGNWMEVRLIGQADRPSNGEKRGREVGDAGRFVPYRDWREEAAGSRKLKAAFLSRLGRGAPKRQLSRLRCLVNRLIRPPEIGLAPIFCV
jgi:hypothetical protein